MGFKIYFYDRNGRKGLILNQDQGWGEIAPLPGFSKETLEEAHQEILSYVRTGTPPTLPSVRFGISCASKPFPAEPIHIPLCALNKPRAGFTTLKLKLKSLSIKDAIRLVKQHKNYRLRIDCNRAWTLDQTLAFASHFSPDDFEYLEEPARTFEELIAFSKTTHFPIALDESISSSWDQVPSLKAIVVKPTVVGFIPKFSNVILSSAYETGVGLLNIARLHQSKAPIGLDTVFADDLLTSPIRCENGFFSWNPTSANPVDLSKLCAL